MWFFAATNPDKKQRLVRLPSLGRLLAHLHKQSTHTFFLENKILANIGRHVTKTTTNQRRVGEKSDKHAGKKLRVKHAELNCIGGRRRLRHSFFEQRMACKNTLLQHFHGRSCFICGHTT
jgi:hypothetical protein